MLIRTEAFARNLRGKYDRGPETSLFSGNDLESAGWSSILSMALKLKRPSWLSPSKSLQTRLGATTAATAILLSTLLSLIVGQISRTQLEHHIQRSLLKLAEQAADRLDQGMFERYRDISILASLEPIRQEQYSPLEKRQFLEDQQQSYPAYAWIGITDDQGTVTASTQGHLEGKNVTQRPWYQNSTAHISVGDVHEAKLLANLLPNPTGEPLRFVDVAAPIRDRQGKFLGVIGAHLSWTWAEEVLQSIGTIVGNEPVEVLILSRNNTVLLGPQSLQGQTLNPEAQPNYTTGFARTQGYRNYPGLGWSVLVRQPTEIALAPARSLQLQVFLYGTGLGLLFALWSIYRARQIVQPLQQLTIAADQISQGDRNYKIPHLERKDELERLAQAFEHMMTTLNTQEDQLREQAALLDIATDAIFVRSLDWTILFWNQGATHTYGWTATEAIGQNVSELLHQESIRLQLAEERLLQTGEWRGELKKITKAGKELILESHWMLARNATGNPKFILTVDTDITEKKRLEEQFLRAQRLENLGALAGGIAHDMNNILTPIITSAQLLQIQSPDSDDFSARMLKILIDSSLRGADLVKQILSFARGVSGECTSVQLNHILKEIHQILQSTFPKDITIAINSSNELWMLSADSTQLHQILMNLCVNARDAMPKGGTLTLSARNLHQSPIHPEAQPGSYILLTIADTGEGIHPEILDHIFEPFYTTKEIGKGTGLGLSTVHGIVKSHGGFITVQSKPGQGTCFSIYLPAEVDTRLIPDPKKSIVPCGTNELILIIDDEPFILDVTKPSLEAHGYQVMTAANGVEALLCYQEHRDRIQVILMDLMMPELDGIHAIEGLKKLNPQLRIIASSGLLKEEKLTTTVSAFLAKPYTLEQLLHTLHDTLHPEPQHSI
jgi:PAS domain S-box-containing protein